MGTVYKARAAIASLGECLGFRHKGSESREGAAMEWMIRIVVGVLFVAVLAVAGVFIYASTLSPPMQSYEKTVPVPAG
ncbi:MAG TPA: hypothetical protein VK779_07840 [Rhizomicrobium sp.]|jgi:hypothetical protein|nr:hypothetical protein [Rhizomicrobium sp.]